MSYIDGFLVPVPKAAKDQYRELAELSATVFKDHGALQVVEAWADDVPEGKLTSFPMAVKCTEDEVVVFSYVVWPSREARDAGMAKSMEDPRMQFVSESNVPFDGKRMIFGGFETIVDR